MCENCSPESLAKTTKAYEEFEPALRKFLEDIDCADGIIVDWVITMSQSIITGEENHDRTMTCWIPRLNQPTYRTKGLLHEVLDNAQAADITHRIKHE